MLCSVLQQSFFLGSKGHPNTDQRRHHFLSWLALLVGFGLSHHRGFSWECSCVRREWKLAVHRDSPLAGRHRIPYAARRVNSLNSSLILQHNPTIESAMLLCQVLAACCQPTNLEGALTVEMLGVTLLLTNCLSLCTSTESFLCSSIMYPNYTIYLELCRTVHPCFLQKHLKFSQ